MADENKDAAATGEEEMPELENQDAGNDSQFNRNEKKCRK